MKSCDEASAGGRPTLDEATAGDNPIALFQSWFALAQAAETPEPTGMTLSTVGTDGAPSARIVLCKHVDERGFVFYTNLESRKGGELAANPRVALTFWWATLASQVRIEGSAQRTSDSESDAYFQSRDLPRRLGAWASPQSEEIDSRQALDTALAEAMVRFADGEVPRPPFWGGYRVEPARIEFWTERPGRLHDRLRFTRRDKGGWTRVRLAP